MRADLQLLLLTFPEHSLGVVRSELNSSVVLGCPPNRITPALVIHWTFNGQPRGTGERLLLRRLAREHLGTYTCSARSTQGRPSSKSVDVSLPGECPPRPGPRHPCRPLAGFPGSTGPPAGSCAAPWSAHRA